MTGPVTEAVRSEIDDALAAMNAVRLQQERDSFNFQNSGNAAGYKIATNQVGVNGGDASPEGERKKEERRENTQRLVAQQEAYIQQLVTDIQEAQIDYITNTYDSNYRANVEYLREVDPSLFEASDAVAEMRARGEVNESPATKSIEGQQIIGMADGELAAEAARLKAEKERDANLSQQQGNQTETSMSFNAQASAEPSTPQQPAPEVPKFDVNSPANKGLNL